MHVFCPYLRYHLNLGRNSQLAVKSSFVCLTFHFHWCKVFVANHRLSSQIDASIASFLIKLFWFQVYSPTMNDADGHYVSQKQVTQWKKQALLLINGSFIFIAYFMSGFFLTKRELGLKSTCDVSICMSSQSYISWLHVYVGVQIDLTKMHFVVMTFVRILVVSLFP